MLTWLSFRVTLAKIYKKYQQVLLEKNVRTFLQFKGKVNKGIRKTLREELICSFLTTMVYQVPQQKLKQKSRKVLFTLPNCMIGKL